MAAHPNVKINVTVLENEAFKAKLATDLAGGNVPDLFQSWGGGGMAEQVEAGLLKDISSDLTCKDQINTGALGLYAQDGKQYGAPFDLGMVGFWYNKAQFADGRDHDARRRPGTSSWPTSTSSRTADITPIALGGKDKWPGMFWWAYLALRAGGSEAMQNAVATGDWSGPAFVQAGTELKKLIDMEPFQEGFLAAPWDGAGGQAATMADRQGRHAAHGPVGPGHDERQLLGRRAGIGDDLGWFPFPALTGGAGAADDAFGGGNGFVVGKDAPPETVDFLCFLTSTRRGQPVGRHEQRHPADDHRHRSPRSRIRT